MSNNPTPWWVQNIFGRLGLFKSGVGIPAQPNLNFDGVGVTVTPDPANRANRVSVTGTGASLAKRVDGSSAAVPQGYGVMHKNGKVTLAQQSALGASLFIAGIALTGGNANDSITIVTQGPVDPSVFNLGAGVACAVGLAANGKPVRITDPSCVSRLKHVAFCDADGSIYVAPKNAENVNVCDFGAVGAETDDTTAIQAAITFAKANAPVNGKFAGMRIHFPPGVYLCSSQLDFDATADDITHDWPGTTLSGEGGGITDSGSNRGASTLMFTGTGAGSFISARSSANFSIRNLCVLYSSGSYTGTLVDCGQDPTLAAATTYAIFKDCNFGCDGATFQTAAAMISLDGSEATFVEACHIGGANYGVVCAIEGAGGSSVQTVIRGCQFDTLTTAGVVNPSINATIDGNVFEFVPHAVLCDFTTNNTPGIFGLTFANNWCGDPGGANRAYAWIDLGKGVLSGGAIYSNFFGGIDDGGNHALSQKDSIKLGSAAGVAIYGNCLITVDFSLASGGSYAQGVTIFGNQLTSGNTAGAPYWRNLNNACSCVSIFGNVPIGKDQAALDQVSIGGHIVTYPTMGVAPGTSAGTHGTLATEGSAFQGSNDTCGRVTLTVAGGSMDHTAALGTVTFANAFDNAFGYKPKVVLMPENAATAGLPELATPVEIYVVPTWTGFAIWATADLPVGSYQWSYMVMG